MSGRDPEDFPQAVDGDPVVSGVPALQDDSVYYRLDLATGLFECERNWLSRFGYPHADMTVSLWLEMMPVDDRLRVEGELQRLKEGMIDRLCVTYRMADVQGVAFSVETRMARERLPDDSREVHGIHRLVTGWADSAQWHELANDMASVIGYAELLRDSALAPDQQSYVSEILLSARRAAMRLAPEGGRGELLGRLGAELSIETLPHRSPAEPAPGFGDLVRILRPILERRRRHAGTAAGFHLEMGAWSDVEAYRCGVCGESLGARRCVVSLHDDGPPIPRTLLPCFLEAGFDLLEVSADAGPQDEVTEAVALLHRLGGHITLKSTETETCIAIHVPERKPIAPD